MCDDSCAIIPPLSLEYYEAKISVFSWKPALEMPRYVEIQIFLFLKARSTEEVKVLELWRKLREIQLNLENVDTYNMKKNLIKSHIVPILQYAHVN